MITIGIIIICVVVFILTLVDKDNDQVNKAIKYGGLYVPRIEDENQYWRLLTSNFVHVDIAHIFMNCYGIYYLGTFFEDFLGTIPYLYLIIMTMIISSLVTFIVGVKYAKYRYQVTLGASGIFYGYLGAMIVLGLVFQGPFLELLKSFTYIILINLAFTFFYKRVSKTGHIGGLIGGVIGMLVLIVTGVCAY